MFFTFHTDCSFFRKTVKFFEFFFKDFQTFFKSLVKNIFVERNEIFRASTAKFVDFNVKLFHGNICNTRSLKKILKNFEINIFVVSEMIEKLHMASQTLTDLFELRKEKVQRLFSCRVNFWINLLITFFHYYYYYGESMSSISLIRPIFVDISIESNLWLGIYA